MISLSNGFMMYSLAPALMASWMCAISFSVVQKTTFGASPPLTGPERPQKFDAVHDRHIPIEQDDLRHTGLTRLQRLLTIGGLGNIEIEFLENFPGDHTNDLGIIDNQAGFHDLFSINA